MRRGREEGKPALRLLLRGAPGIPAGESYRGRSPDPARGAFEFRTATQSFSPAVLEPDAALRAGRFRQGGNPVLEWCVGNVVGKADRRGNLCPAKARSERKINAAVAMLMAIGCAQASEGDGAEDITAFVPNPVMG